jgi:cell division protein FtsZ
MMKDSGMALMGCGTGTGENRIEDAVRSALESPLLNDFDLTTAKNVLVNITVGKNGKGVTMSQLKQINEMINEYTGNANSFKSGIVYELDESFGDRLNLTVIVTGFKMNMLEDLTEGKVGNIIFIDSNFEYRKDAPTSEDGIELPEVRTLKIGYNKNDVRKKIVFSEDKKPALLIGEGVNRSELEHVAAIRRKSGKAERREE